MMEWLDMLRAAIDDEFGQRPRVVTLATVDAGGPAARSVVCRRIDQKGWLYFASDGRSAKNGQLRVNASGEIVCWLPTRREQFRVSGPVNILDALNNQPARTELWRGLSDATRATFLWPTPGTPRSADESAFPRETSATSPVPPTFEVLVLRPHEVEFLDLKPHPHDRRRWIAADAWRERRLNP